LTKETLPPEKRTRLSLPSAFKNYSSILANFPFMAHTFIWCLMFSMVIVFIANLSLIFVDYLKVSKEMFGYYQTAIMGTFFAGSMGGAYLIKKIGMVPTKVMGSLVYIAGIGFLALLMFFGGNAPLLLIIAMSLASLGSALAGTIYFSYSMSYIGEHLKGSAMSLTQSLRLFLSSGLVWLAARNFDGSTRPMTVLALVCIAACAIFYAMLYRRNQHIAPAAKVEESGI
jgi:DHA1 family bicyclomycin/chloramphenicol resistance-like MFS transporter